MANRNTRRAAWGSLTYDAKTRTARIRYWAETPQGYRRCSKTFRDVTRKQAEEHRAALMLEHGNDAPCPTVAQVWERWTLPMYEQRLASGEVSKSSVNKYMYTYGRHVASRWGDVPCDEVRPLGVQQWISSMDTYEQARLACVVLSAALDMAMRYEVVPSNVMRAKYVMPPKSTVKRADKGIWTLAELSEVWQHVHGSAIEPAFLLSAFGSCRVGESMAATVEDVERRVQDGITLAVVRIDKQVGNKGREVVHDTKTKSSTRSVVLAGRAAARLLSIADSCACEWLTNDGVGRNMSQRLLNKLWSQLVPADMYHPYRNLRNAWQTWMRWELGVAPWLIEVLMGHKADGVTGQYYDRPQVDVFCETVANAYAANPYDAKWTWLDADK